MSTEERATWASALATLVIPGFYFARVLGEARDNPVADIDYQGLLIWNIGILVVTTIVLVILLTIGHAIWIHASAEVAAAKTGQPVDPEQVDRAMKSIDRSDARDKAISRRGDAVTAVVLMTGCLAPLMLAMAEREQFWIAQSLYGALILAGLAGSTAKIIAYRRGF